MALCTAFTAEEKCEVNCRLLDSLFMTQEPIIVFITVVLRKDHFIIILEFPMTLCETVNLLNIKF